MARPLVVESTDRRVPDLTGKSPATEVSEGFLESIGGLVQGTRIIVDRNSELVDHPLHLIEFLLDEVL